MAYFKHSGVQPPLKITGLDPSVLSNFRPILKCHLEKVFYYLLYDHVTHITQSDSKWEIFNFASDRSDIRKRQSILCCLAPICCRSNTMDVLPSWNSITICVSFWFHFVGCLFLFFFFLLFLLSHFYFNLMFCFCI